MNKVKCLLILVSAFILFADTSFAQNKSLLQIKQSIDSGNFKQALQKLHKTNISSFTTTEKADYYYYNAVADAKENNADLAFRHYAKAKQLYLKAGKTDAAQEINLDLSRLLNSQENNINDPWKYVNEYFDYAVQSNDPLKLTKAYKQVATMKLDEHPKESLFNFKKALYYNAIAKDSTLHSAIYNNLGVLYNEQLNKPDSGLYYLGNALKYDIVMDKGNSICYNYINHASSYLHLGNNKKAIEFLKKAEKAPIREFKKNTKSYIYSFLSENYSRIGDYQNAFKYLNLYNTYKDSINQENQNIAISELLTKYETEKKEFENKFLKSENKLLDNRRKNNQNIMIAFIGLFLASVVIAWLLLKNSSRSRQLAIQQTQLGEQKLLTLLSQQELQIIDSMLAGQEKERQQIANELHDDLGSMLTTIKLNFQNLKLKKVNNPETEQKIYDHTDELIEEAYQKVRGIAHIQNSGVIANEGLIPAIQKMTEKISIIKGLQIDMFCDGMEERLDNKMEIDIFRMIRELITNIIKHSQASQVNIYLTRHNSNWINIMIEDNGKGFDLNAISLQDGMGLQSMGKKTEQFGGTFTIDTKPGNGTTIIIDLSV